MPPQPDSPYALEGTDAHTLAEWCLRNNKDAAEVVGYKGEDHNWTDDMAEAVQVYLNVIRADMAEYEVHPSDLQIEHRFHLDFIDPDAFGTNDANIVVFGKKIIVYDYKHGSGVAVDAEDNKQGLFYALGASYGLDFDEIEVVIVQPRAFHPDGPVRRWIVSANNLKIFAEELCRAIGATKDEDAPLKCGDWCKKTFCAAMATCPAVRKQVNADSQMVFAKGTVQLPKPENMTKADLRRVLDGLPLFEAWTKAVWAFAEAKANNGDDLPGYKLVRGREGNRKWADESETKKILSPLVTNPDSLYEKTLLSPAKMEKEFGKKGKELISPLIIRSEGKIILVSEDDPREAVSPNVTNAFQDKLE